MSVVPLGFVRSPELTSPRPFLSATKADPGNPAVIAAALQHYLGGPALSYQEDPQAIGWGWETFIYRMQLQTTADLPAALSGPLILRIYTSAGGVSRVRGEFTLQQRLYELGFPVPKPVHLETDCSLFGGPFMLMERIAGETLFHRTLQHPTEVRSLSDRMAECHARLHALPADQILPSSGGFLSRRLAELRELIDLYDLHGLRAGLDWLFLHRPPPCREPSLVHLDWHPLNLIRADNGGLWALDWHEADVGDPHADVAMTLLLLYYAPTDCRSGWEKLAVPIGRRWIAHRYRRTYSRLRNLDAQRLAYFRAWAILRRLAKYGRWLKAGPASTGSKEAVLTYLQRSHLAKLCQVFRDGTGVAIHLEHAECLPASRACATEGERRTRQIRPSTR
jgi:aminoglycoside phosphotransferase (APT) family kinase protein